jgi:hypothetical protein
VGRVDNLPRSCRDRHALRGSKRGKIAVAAVAAAAVVAAVFVGSPVSPATAATRLEVSAGMNGFYTPGDHVVVRVTIAADQLVVGDLQVRAPGEVKGSTATLHVEVPGGSVKDFKVIVPTSPFTEGIVQVALTDGRTTLAGGTAQLQTAPDQEFVGVLPQVARRGDIPATSALADDAGTARRFPLTPGDLALGSAALDTLDIIAAGDGELGQLGDRERASVLGWLNAGGRLLVDQSGGTVAGLPEPWQPGVAGYQLAGLGEVRLTGGSLSAGRWSEVLEPTRTRSQAEEGLLTSSMFLPQEPLTVELARDAGFTLPQLGWVVGVLLGYVLLVGPIVFFVLRRMGRAPLAWVVVPGLALVTTLGIFVTGNRLRPSDRVAHATIVEVSPAGATATSYLLVGSRNGGTVTLDLPEGWTPQSPADPDGLQDFISLRHDIARNELSAALDSGQFALAGASGPIEFDGGLELDARSDANDKVIGTVRNGTRVALDDVAVFVGRSGAFRVGHLAAGESKPFTVDRAAQFVFEARPESEVWPEAVPDFEGGFDRRNGAADSAVSAAVWIDHGQRVGFNFRTLGTAVAVGWTREMDAPVRSGGTVDEGRTGVMVRAPIRAAAPQLTDVVSRRQLVRGPSGVVPNANVKEIGNDVGAIFRFLLPGDVNGRAIDPARLRIDVPALFSRAELWMDGSWQPVPGVEPGRQAEVPLPPNALRGGTVLVRVNIPTNSVPGPGREFVLTEAPLQ